MAAGLVLDEPEAPPSASATDVMKDLSSALERLRVAFATPTSGLGAPGPAEEDDKDMEDADVTERATPEEAQTPPTKRLRGFVAASQKTTAHVNKPVSLVPVEGRPGYFKLVDLPDLFPVLPASAATLLRDVTVEEAVSLFHKFVGKNLTEDLVIRILEAYVPMKIQIRQEEVWASQFQRNKACVGTQRMHRLDAGHSDYKFMCKACGTGWPEAAKQCWVCPGKEFVPFQAPSATYEADGITYNLLIVEGKHPAAGRAWVPLAPVVPGHRPTATWWTARSWGELLRKRTRQRRSPWQTRSRLTGGWTSGRRSCPWRRTTRR